MSDANNNEKPTKRKKKLTLFQTHRRKSGKASVASASTTGGPSADGGDGASNTMKYHNHPTERGKTYSKVIGIFALMFCGVFVLNRFFIMNMLEPRPDSELSGSKKNHMPTCYDRHVWDALPKEGKHAAMTIGYTKTIWETDEALPGVDDAAWDELGMEITQAIQKLGYTKETWECDRCDGCFATSNAPNLIFVMVDQLKYDALSIMGNTVLDTPNIDRIGNEGVKFELCYSQCPVCGPARTSLMTGRTIHHTAVPMNPSTTQYFDHGKIPCYDKILSNLGYATEYYGKWHAPMEQALGYNNLITSTGSWWKYGPGMQRQYTYYLEDHNIPSVHLSGNKKYAGMQIQKLDRRPYKTNALDSRHGLPPEGIKKEVKQPDQHGVSTIPGNYTITAFQAKQCLEALDRLGRKEEPFSLHLSFHSPHAPMTPSEPFASMYDPTDMHPPTSISDPMENSPYRNKNGRLKYTQYADPQKIKYMISNYYALVKEIDEWVGKILALIDQLNLTENTMLIFTSDHGEMLGSHGMREKNNFYEESVRVPLLIRFPGRIKPGTVVTDKPVSHIDLFATIFDYLGVGKYPSDGESLRKFIDGSGKDEETFAVSEWAPDENDPNFMIRSKRWKFMCPCRANSTVMNALYDLESDPNELNNLLGKNSKKKQHAAQGEVMKNELVQWLKKVGSPYLNEVKMRKVLL